MPPRPPPPILGPPLLRIMRGAAAGAAMEGMMGDAMSAEEPKESSTDSIMGSAGALS